MYTNDLAELRKIREQRYREARDTELPQRSHPNVRASGESARVHNNAVKFQQKYGFTGAPRFSGTNSEPVKNNKLVSLAFQATDEIKSFAKSMVSRFTDMDIGDDDSELIAKLKEKEEMEKKRRAARRIAKKASFSSIKAPDEQVKDNNNTAKIKDASRGTALFSTLNIEESDYPQAAMSSGRNLPVTGKWFQIVTYDAADLHRLMCNTKILDRKSIRKHINRTTHRPKRVNKPLADGASLPPYSNFLRQFQGFDVARRKLLSHLLQIGKANPQGSTLAQQEKDQSHIIEYFSQIRRDSDEPQVKLHTSLAIRKVLFNYSLQECSAMSQSDLIPMKALQTATDRNRIRISDKSGEYFLNAISSVSRKKQLVILLRAGEAAFAAFEDGQPVLSKVIKKYVIRKAQGSAQFLKDGGYGGSRVHFFRKRSNAVPNEDSHYEPEGDHAEPTSQSISFSKKRIKSAGRRKGGCRSVGSQIRRSQFDEFIESVQEFIASEPWRIAVQNADIIWISSTNLQLAQHIFYSPRNKAYETLLAQRARKSTSSPLDVVVFDDPRVHRIPIMTHKPSYSEASRCFLHLNSVYISTYESD